MLEEDSREVTEEREICNERHYELERKYKHLLKDYRKIMTKFLCAKRLMYPDQLKTFEDIEASRPEE